MRIEDFFLDQKLTQTEEDIIIQIFTQPIVKKYLQIMARNDLAELASLSLNNLDDKELSKKHSLVQGKLSVLATLSSFQKPKEPQS